MNVYTYWKCVHCESIVRGSNRVCPNCGSPIPNNVKYMMPDNPEVVNAVKNGKILTGPNTMVDENGVTSEIVEEENIRKDPNWLCEFCGCQNYAENTHCEGCGSPRSNKRYFNTPETNTKCKSTEIDQNEPPYINENVKALCEKDLANPEGIKAKIENLWITVKEHAPSIFKVFCIILSLLITAMVPFLLFMHVEREATVKDFCWERSISVEEYKLCHENDWSVPYGAKITHQQEEIHHYDQVLDHYETKTRTVTEQVFDGYDTSYIDLGNGQASVEYTPRYRTECKTETYQDPVYEDVPVYRIKYYYDIGRWIYDKSLVTSGNDQDPYWCETDIPEDIEDPLYGDKRLGKRTEFYTVRLIDKEGNEYNSNLPFREWIELKPDDKIKYESHWWSTSPLSDIEILS